MKKGSIYLRNYGRKMTMFKIDKQIKDETASQANLLCKITQISKVKE
jgi:hypothetical protein